MRLRATSFATFKDLVGYIRCRDAGQSQAECLWKGDNGVGAWGDTTAQLHTPMVALSRANGAQKHRKVRVTVNGCVPFVAIVGDIAPAGVVDLNPAALVAAGLPIDAELSRPAEVNFL